MANTHKPSNRNILELQEIADVLRQLFTKFKCLRALQSANSTRAQILAFLRNAGSIHDLNVFNDCLRIPITKKLKDVKLQLIGSRYSSRTVFFRLSKGTFKRIEKTKYAFDNHVVTCFEEKLLLHGCSFTSNHASDVASECLIVDKDLDIVQVLMALSDGFCFCKAPLVFQSLRLPLWLVNLPIVSAGQILAGYLEVQIFDAWKISSSRISNGSSTSPSRGNDQFHRSVTTLLDASSNFRFPPLLKHAVKDTIFQDIARCTDIAKFQMIYNLNKSKVKEGDLLSNVPFSSVITSNHCLLRLWLLVDLLETHAPNHDRLHTLLCPASSDRIRDYQSRGSSTRNSVTELLLIPLILIATPTHEFRSAFSKRVIDLSHQIVCDLNFPALESTMDEHKVTTRDANDSIKANNQHALPTRISKGGVRRKMIDRLSPKSKEEKYEGFDLSKEKSKKDYSIQLNIGVWPSQLSSVHLEKTTAIIIVSQILDDIFEKVISIMHRECSTRTRNYRGKSHETNYHRNRKKHLHLVESRQVITSVDLENRRGSLSGGDDHSDSSINSCSNSVMTEGTSLATDAGAEIGQFEIEGDSPKGNFLELDDHWNSIVFGDSQPVVVPASPNNFGRLWDRFLDYSIPYRGLPRANELDDDTESARSSDLRHVQMPPNMSFDAEDIDNSHSDGLGVIEPSNLSGTTAEIELNEQLQESSATIQFGRDGEDVIKSFVDPEEVPVVSDEIDCAGNEALTSKEPQSNVDESVVLGIGLTSQGCVEPVLIDPVSNSDMKVLTDIYRSGERSTERPRTRSFDATVQQSIMMAANKSNEVFLQSRTSFQLRPSTPFSADSQFQSTTTTTNIASLIGNEDLTPFDQYSVVSSGNSVGVKTTIPMKSEVASLKMHVLFLEINFLRSECSRAVLLNQEAVYRSVILRIYGDDVQHDVEYAQPMVMEQATAVSHSSLRPMLRYQGSHLFVPGANTILGGSPLQPAIPPAHDVMSEDGDRDRDKYLYTTKYWMMRRGTIDTVPTSIANIPSGIGQSYSLGGNPLSSSNRDRIAQLSMDALLPLKPLHSPSSPAITGPAFNTSFSTEHNAFPIARAGSPPLPTIASAFHYEADTRCSNNLSREAQAKDVAHISLQKSNSSLRNSSNTHISVLDNLMSVTKSSSLLEVVDSSDGQLVETVRNGTPVSTSSGTETTALGLSSSISVIPPATNNLKVNGNKTQSLKRIPSAANLSTPASLGISNSLLSNAAIAASRTIASMSNDIVASTLNLTREHIVSSLSKEIVSFVGRIDAFESKLRSAKMEVFERLRTVVQNLWPRAQVKIFGSFVSQLSLPTSDVDLVICLPKVHWEAGPEAPGVLEGRNAIKETWQQNLARYLRKEDWVLENSIRIIGNATIPVLKLRTKPWSRRQDELIPSFSLDVSFEGKGHKGLEANKFIQTRMKDQPHLRPLVLVLKYFLAKRSLGESYTGGLSSYALLLMVAQFLQEAQNRHDSTDVLDLGALLLGFLRFFGETFDPRQTGISVKRRCYFSRAITTAHSPEGARLNYMHIQDSLLVDRRHSFQHPHSMIPRSISSAQSTYVSSTSASGTGVTSSIPMNAYASRLPFKFDPLFIEDPLERSNNVGRNCFRVFQVMRSFCDAFASATEQIRRVETGELLQDAEMLTDLIGPLSFPNHI